MPISLLTYCLCAPPLPPNCVTRMREIGIIVFRGFLKGSDSPIRSHSCRNGVAAVRLRLYTQTLYAVSRAYLKQRIINGTLDSRVCVSSGEMLIVTATIGITRRLRECSPSSYRIIAEWRVWESCRVFIHCLALLSYWACNAEKIGLQKITAHLILRK